MDCGDFEGRNLFYALSLLILSLVISGDTQLGKPCVSCFPRTSSATSLNTVDSKDSHRSEMSRAVSSKGRAWKRLVNSSRNLSFVTGSCSFFQLNFGLLHIDLTRSETCNKLYAFDAIIGVQLNCVIGYSFAGS